MPAERIEGLEDTLKFFDAQPGNAFRLIQKAMKSGGKAAAKDLKKQMPKRFSALAKSKAGVDARGEAWVRFGMYNNQRAQGHQPKAYRGSEGGDGITDWFKFYWRNYGTLTLRDPTHAFATGVRKKTRRNNVGQPPRNEYDRAVDQAKTRFTEAFESELARGRDELLKR